MTDIILNGRKLSFKEMKEDFIQTINNMTFHITTSDYQRKNLYNNISFPSSKEILLSPIILQSLASSGENS